MRHRPILFIAIGAVAAGVVALAVIPGTGTARIAEAQADQPVASVINPNPDLLRRLDAEVAVPKDAPASVETVAAVEPVNTPAPPAPASSIEPPAPAGVSDQVGSSAVNLRSGPGGAYGTVGVLQPGDQVSVTSKSGGWAQVSLTDGRTGWVYATYLDNGGGNAPAATSTPPPPATPAPQVASNDNAVPRATVRGANGSDLVDRWAHIGSELPGFASPSSSAHSIFTFEPGDEVRIAEVRGNWLRVETDDGTSAWIRR